MTLVPFCMEDQLTMTRFSVQRPCGSLCISVRGDGENRFSSLFKDELTRMKETEHSKANFPFQLSFGRGNWDEHRRDIGATPATHEPAHSSSNEGTSVGCIRVGSESRHLLVARFERAQHGAGNLCALSTGFAVYAHE